MIKKGDNMGIALSGGKDSSALLHILNKIQKKNGTFHLSALLIDEGISGYRTKTKKFAQKICKKEDVPLVIVDYKKEYGSKLDEMLKKSDSSPCTVCGVLRRYSLNKFAHDLGFTKLATGHNLDDEAQSVLMNFFKNNMDIQARLGPVTGVVRHEDFVPRIKPFYLLTEKEVATYSYLNGLLLIADCPYHKEALREDVRNLLNNFEKDYPGSKHGLINAFLRMLPLLKGNVKESGGIKNCIRCGQPSARILCKCCELVELFK
tara:strand:+ start:664 stop:1449 length:786 start_codon:yes stop_codon:yes gene_type:complete